MESHITDALPLDLYDTVDLWMLAVSLHRTPDYQLNAEVQRISDMLSCTICSEKRAPTAEATYVHHFLQSMSPTDLARLAIALNQIWRSRGAQICLTSRETKKSVEQIDSVCVKVTRCSVQK